MSYRGRQHDNYHGQQDRYYYNQDFNREPEAPQPSTSRGRGRGRGAPRGGRPAPQRSEPRRFERNERRREERVEKPPIQSMPEPKHLSKTSSELTNDPLYEESFFKDFGSSLRRDVDDPKIYSGTTGLKYITENLYKAYVTKAAGFAKRMPESALAYYCAILTVQRLLKIHTDNGFSANAETMKFISDIDHAKYYYPKTLARYLSGFGNTRVPGGRTLKFFFPPAVVPKVTVDELRWWGRVTQDTHHLYLDYPCTAVYYSRIVHDFLGFVPEHVDAEEEPDEDIDEDEDIWNLPQRIRPNAWPNAVPNQNLQGWKARVNLSNVQKQFLLTADFNPAHGPRSLEWNYDPSLMNAVSVELENLQYIEAGPAPETAGGSQGQTTFSVPFCDDTVPIVLGEFEGRSNLDVSGPIANLGIKHLYRVKFDTSVSNWSIYWAGESFETVPDLWRGTINTYRDREYPELNLGHFNIEVFDPREFVRLVVERDNRKIKR